MVRPALDPGIAARIRTTGAQERTLPLAGELVECLGPTIQRGATVAVVGGAAPAAAVSLQLAAASSAAGSWVAVVGLPDLGLVAAAEAGIALERFALIPEPNKAWPDAVAAVVDGFDLVLARPPTHLKAGIARRLVARARERGTVLVGVGGWPEGASVRIDVTGVEWEGLAPVVGAATVGSSAPVVRAGVQMAQESEAAGHLRSVRRHLSATGRISPPMRREIAASSGRGRAVGA